MNENISIEVIQETFPLPLYNSLPPDDGRLHRFEAVPSVQPAACTPSVAQFHMTAQLPLQGSGSAPSARSRIIHSRT